jgi:exodeoxyribonuclease VII large subunit
VPVVSAIGHETDYTIADLVADLRAPTPSAAAELVAPDRLEVAVRLGVLAASLLVGCQGEVEGRRAGIGQVVGRMERLIPDLGRERQRVDDLWRTANASLETLLGRCRERLSGFAGQLRSLDPKATLARGYALVQRDGHVVSSVGEVTGGERLSVRVKDGGFPVRVEKAAGTRPLSRQVRRGEKRREGVQPLLMLDP